MSSLSIALRGFATIGAVGIIALIGATAASATVTVDGDSVTIVNDYGSEVSVTFDNEAGGTLLLPADETSVTTCADIAPATSVAISIVDSDSVTVYDETVTLECVTETTPPVVTTEPSEEAAPPVETTAPVATNTAKAASTGIDNPTFGLTPLEGGIAVVVIGIAVAAVVVRRRSAFH